MMRILAILFFSVIAIIALFFSLLNFQVVEINLYVTTIQLPLALALSIELFAGIFIGFFVAFVHILKLKSQYKYLSRQISKGSVDS